MTQHVLVRLGGGRVRFRKPTGTGGPEQPLSGPSRPLPAAASPCDAAPSPASQLALPGPSPAPQRRQPAQPRPPGRGRPDTGSPWSTSPSWPHTLGLALLSRLPGCSLDLGCRGAGSAGFGAGAPQVMPRQRRLGQGCAAVTWPEGRRATWRLSVGERGAGLGPRGRGSQSPGGIRVPNPPSRKGEPGAGRGPQVGAVRGRTRAAHIRGNSAVVGELVAGCFPAHAGVMACPTLEI